jgi:hypothetical protein
VDGGACDEIVTEEKVNSVVRVCAEPGKWANDLTMAASQKSCDVYLW